MRILTSPTLLFSSLAIIIIAFSTLTTATAISSSSSSSPEEPGADLPKEVIIRYTTIVGPNDGNDGSSSSTDLVTEEITVPLEFVSEFYYDGEEVQEEKEDDGPSKHFLRGQYYLSREGGGIEGEGDIDRGKRLITIRMVGGEWYQFCEVYENPRNPVKHFQIRPGMTVTFDDDEDDDNDDGDGDNERRGKLFTRIFCSSRPLNKNGVPIQPPHFPIL